MKPNRETASGMVLVGAVLIFVSMFLPILRCEDSGFWSCRESSFSLFDRSDFEDAEFYEGLIANLEPVTMAVMVAAAIGAVVIGRGLLAVATSLLLYVLYFFYLIWITTDIESSVELSLGWGWVVVLLGTGVIMAGAVQYALAERAEQKTALAYYQSKLAAQAPATSDETPSAIQGGIIMNIQDKRAFTALALIGLLLIFIGCWLPAVEDEYTKSDDDALFEMSRFDEEDDGFKMGMIGNRIAISLFILIAVSIYPALTMRGVRGMSAIILVYASIPAYAFAKDKGTDLGLAWYVIYGGILVLFGARQLYIWQMGEADPLPPHMAEYASRPGGTSGLLGRLSAPTVNPDLKASVWLGSAPDKLMPCGFKVAITSPVLNVRITPGSEGQKLTQISSAESYDVLGKSVDGEWWLIQYPGGRGWIAAAYTETAAGEPSAVSVIE